MPTAVGPAMTNTNFFWNVLSHEQGAGFMNDDDDDDDDDDDMESVRWVVQWGRLVRLEPKGRIHAYDLVHAKEKTINHRKTLVMLGLCFCCKFGRTAPIISLRSNVFLALLAVSLCWVDSERRGSDGWMPCLPVSTD